MNKPLRTLCSIYCNFSVPNIYFGKSLTGVPENSIVLFPFSATMFCCGITGIVAFKNKKQTDDHIDVASLNSMVKKIETHRYADCEQNDLCFEDHFLGGKGLVSSLLQAVRALKCNDSFYNLFVGTESLAELTEFADRLSKIIDSESKFLADHMGRLETGDVEILSRRIEDIKDITWCLNLEIADNIKKVKDLLRHANKTRAISVVNIFKQINAVLNSIDRLEVRGRDSAGISLLFILDGAEFDRFKATIEKANLLDQLKARLDQDVLVNLGISLNETKDRNGQELVALTITYKIAAEIGRLGDNIRFLRKQIKNDAILQRLVTFEHKYHTVSAHTRWASVGAISEPNCHPVDNKIIGRIIPKKGIIHACLNGDIDNYQELKKEYERQGDLIHQEITTDTKIIPLQIEKYLNQGFGVEEAFRLAVNDFKGSHAISMHTDLAPGKLFLGLKGSGQAIFVGLAEDHYIPSSEVYGLIEEAPFFIKMNGEKEVDGKNGITQGQIFILNQESAGGIGGIKAMYYDQTPVELGEKDIKYTEITSRDIDRQNFPHYFLKEISESPLSVEKTLQNRWKIKGDEIQRYVITLEEKAFPEALQKALLNKKIKRIFFVGQGTAGVAALACANILNYYMDDPSFYINAMKASELSGFMLSEDDDSSSMADALVVAISQSGTTTDTNRTVDMVKERGAHTMAIVNRRDSDITFKVDGVMYTSSGRDIEMSVASTKAFYSQIVAGAILGLFIAGLQGRRNDDFVAVEIKQLLELPNHMRKILSMHNKIGNSAKRLAVTKTYWATVGSGPNKASADEIRIKLSELCYKTISSDYIEDKKHIDLSSEPLIIVCAAGIRGTVIGDIIKDTAIFQAHKATPVVIADEGENRFDPYAADVLHVPIVSEHFAPILNTLVGHIWGYYAALAINEGSRFLYEFNKDIQDKIDDHADKGMDVYELILDKSFREKIAFFYKEFRRKKAENNFPTSMGLEAASNLTLLLKYLSGRLPVSDFEIDFGKKGTAMNMLNTLFECLGESINSLARPVDAIRHQAKTVTVGTSRISEKLEGILFETLAAYNINVSQLINRNILVLKNLQEIVSGINGAILYKIGGLNLLGEPTDETTIEIIKKEGILKPIPSRVETDNQLKGTKRIIVREGNVYIGKGRKDDRSIIVIPIISTSPVTPNMIEYILLLTIEFNENVSLAVKIKALGGKYERIENIVQENSVAWDDQYLELVEMRQLFGISAEKIGEFIVSRIS
ncbi:MAG: glutamine--fructose-6-phosphate aminotransferase [Desulfobacterales bacterium PC51MH44]|nr:MAG: glutamine--fructose-6-phosphate aminotransferase [Desulfobacterales bacterium PC51MH44]